MHALAGARKSTGRRRIVVFSGGYHGAVFSFGDGSLAVNNVDREDFVVATYNDTQRACSTIATTPDLAAGPGGADAGIGG